jgi:predicted nucleic acid-binding protein
MRGIVIADAGPVIGLSRVGQLDLLAQLYGAVWLTEVVRDELLAQAQIPFVGQDQIQLALSDWMQVQTDLGAEFQPLTAHLDAGEYSSIRLCLKHPGSLLVADDRAARLEARLHQIAHTGLLGVLLLAQEKGLVCALRPVLTALREQNYYIRDALQEQVLVQVGEGAT